jgi:hypothetical protein
MELSVLPGFVRIGVMGLPRGRSLDELAERAATEMLEASALLTRRGRGDGAGAAPFLHDPIAFLLDSISDAANVWGPGGKLLYRNRAATELDIGYFHLAPVQQFYLNRRCFERRGIRCRSHGSEYLLEIIRELKQEPNGKPV